MQNMKCQVSKHHIIDIYIYNTLSEENQQLELRLVWARDEDWGASTDFYSTRSDFGPLCSSCQWRITTRGKAFRKRWLAVQSVIDARAHISWQRHMGTDLFLIQIEIYSVRTITYCIFKDAGLEAMLRRGRLAEM